MVRGTPAAPCINTRRGKVLRGGGGRFQRGQKPGFNCQQSHDNTVSVLLGNGDGTFQAHVDYPTGQAPTSVTIGDFNGDGKLDLAVINQDDNTVSILLGNGDGTFESKW